MKRPGEPRTLVMRALHAEGAKRGLGHEELREMCQARFGLASMGELTLAQAGTLYVGITGREFLIRKKVTLPKRGYGKHGEAEMASPEEIELLGRAFARRGWGPETRAAFLRRQLHGRDKVRTRADFQKVFRGVQAMNRRDELLSRRNAA